MRRTLGRIGVVVTLIQIGMAVREHWLSIPAVRRERMSELVGHSRLRPSNLSRAEKRELRQLLAGMRLPVLGQRLAGIALAKRRRRG